MREMEKKLGKPIILSSRLLPIRLSSLVLPEQAYMHLVEKHCSPQLSNYWKKIRHVFCVIPPLSARNARIEF